MVDLGDVEQPDLTVTSRVHLKGILALCCFFALFARAIIPVREI